MANNEPRSLTSCQLKFVAKNGTIDLDNCTNFSDNTTIENSLNISLISLKNQVDNFELFPLDNSSNFSLIFQIGDVVCSFEYEELFSLSEQKLGKCRTLTKFRLVAIVYGPSLTLILIVLVIIILCKKFKHRKNVFGDSFVFVDHK